jgi:cell division protein FtsI (penicillin-binding protein 3)
MRGRKPASQRKGYSGTTGGTGGTGGIARGAHDKRIFIVVGIVVAIALVVFVRLFLLTVIDAPALAEQAQDQRTSEVTIPARRGTIYDRNGNILATSVDATTIYANPTEITDASATANALQKVLGGDAQTYLSELTQDPTSTFVYILRQGDPQMATNLQAEEQQFEDDYTSNIGQGNQVQQTITTPLTGIHYLSDSKRVYPYGNVGAQIIGAVNTDGDGISGLEQTYDSILRGVDGKEVVQSGKDGTPIPNGTVVESNATDGQDIMVTLDMQLQQYVESQLQASGSANDCDNANAILLDGATGEILAAASLPLYNRDNPSAADIANGATTCKAITYSYEPGSTFKATTMASALESGVMGTEDTVFCPAALQIYDHTITDAEERSDETMSMRQVLTVSSNVGASLIEQKIGDDKFYAYLQKFGFGQATHVDYPGEAIGELADVSKWTPIQAANISFGQGMQISTLQLASFYGAIADGGTKITPHFLYARPQDDTQIKYDSTKIFSSDTASKLTSMLRSVVTDGTGKKADISGYDIVGKTGTAQIVDPSSGGYYADKYICSFVGYVANSSSDIVCMTSMYNPTGALANAPTSPLFKTIMQYVINEYDITQQ